MSKWFQIKWETNYYGWMKQNWKFCLDLTFLLKNAGHLFHFARRKVYLYIIQYKITIVYLFVDLKSWKKTRQKHKNKTSKWLIQLQYQISSLCKILCKILSIFTAPSLIQAFLSRWTTQFAYVFLSLVPGPLFLALSTNNENGHFPST